MECQKYEVSRNFWFWQKFLSFSLSTEHFSKKCRKMLKNSFFQTWRQSIVFAYFREKLILKGVFCSQLWISRTQIQITFGKKNLSWFLVYPPPPNLMKKISMKKTTMLFFWCAWCVHIPFFDFQVTMDLSQWCILNWVTIRHFWRKLWTFFLTFFRKSRPKSGGVDHFLNDH